MEARREDGRKIDMNTKKVHMRLGKGTLLKNPRRFKRMTIELLFYIGQNPDNPGLSDKTDLNPTFLIR
jgi:hypothetical protein